MLREQYRHDSIALDISNRILLNLVEEANLPSNLEDWVSCRADVHAEKYFNELWMYCYRYALDLTKQAETAEDIAQASLGALFQSKKEVLFVRGWLKTTIYHNVAALSKQRAKTRKMHNEANQAVQHDYPPCISDEDKALKTLDRAHIRKLLSPQDYRLFVRIKRFPNLKLYAEASGISYQTAREHKHRIKTNLKSAYLREQGWEGSQEILDFRQMINLKKFMKALINHAINGDLDKMKKYCPKDKQQLVCKTLKNLNEVSDWGIYMSGVNKYVLSIFDASLEGLPNTYRIDIQMNRANQIRITSCKQLKLMGVIDTEQAGPLPIEKGKCMLTIEEITELLKKFGGTIINPSEI
jgi:DNA-directed RNA polymerase specialized sigma24 family protein